MAKPEKRWQLLLVADDGRIIPFKRIKGIAVTLVVLLVLLGLACVGLGWRLTVEKVRQHRIVAQLADAREQAALYKSEHELISAELVLAESRMEKAGLPVPRREERLVPQPSVETDAAESAANPPPAPAARSESNPAPAAKPSAAMAAKVSAARAKAPEIPSAKTAPLEPEQPAVALGDLKMTYDTGKKILAARFRVKNNGPRSSPVEGRCSVVLKSDRLGPQGWWGMPDGITLAGGRPDGKQGQTFKISRFINLEIRAAGPADASTFRTATIYVFDTSGAMLLEKAYPIDLPVPEPEPVAASTPQSGPPPTTSAEPDASGISLDDLKIEPDAQHHILWARFQLKKTGPPALPLEGRCVVVLKSERIDPKAWLAMPDGVRLAEGIPDGKAGQEFKISRFKDMGIKAVAPANPSIFKSAGVYVFDASGVKILEREFPVDLPVSALQTEPASPPASEAVVEAGTVELPEAVVPADDSSLTQGGAPASQEDSQTRSE